MKILVPTDFSPLSDKACDASIELAKKLNAEIVLVHTIEVNHVWEEVADFSKVEGMIDGDYSYMHVAELLAKKKLKAIQEVFSMNDIRSTSEVLTGKPHHSIVDFVKENSIDLVLMATHGADGLKEVFIGSNAQKIIRNSPCPVLTIKEENINLNEVLFVSDFNEEEDQVFSFLKKFTEFFEARVTFLKVITPLVFTAEDEIKESINTVADKNGFTNYKASVIKSESVEEGITAYCELNDIGFVALATHGKGFFRKVFVSNTTEYLVNHLNKPILSIPFQF